MEGSYIVFSRPVGNVQAGEPVQVTTENADVLRQAADNGVDYEKIGPWADRTKHRWAGGKRGGYAPVLD